jgi:site-specific DNA recombinase
MQDDQPNNLRVAFYCRVSTEEQREGQTIDSQVAELDRFAQERKWTVVDVYKDEGWSGSLLARPALDQLRDHAHQGRFEAIVVNDVDRLARDVSHLGIVKRDLESRNVRVVFRKLPGEESPTHNLLINILGSFAEFERELITDRTRRGRRHKVEVRKQHIGAIPPYGFKYISKLNSGGEPGHLEILADEAAIVRRMYYWVDQDGLSTQKVVGRLNVLGIRPRKGGTRWQKSSVRRILRSEVYAGVWHYNKHVHTEPLQPTRHKYRKSLRSSLRLRPRSQWIPVPLPEESRIIAPHIWQRVQQQIDRNTALSPRNSKHNYLLKGLVRCGGCSGAYVGDPGRGTFSYRCVNRCKRQPSIREDFLNETIWIAVKKALQNPQIIAAGIKSVAQENRTEGQSGINYDKRALEQIRSEETRILQAYRLGALTAEQLKPELEALRARASLINSGKSEHAPTVNINSVLHSIEDYRRAIPGRLETLRWDQKRKILLHLLTKITFEGDRVTITGRVSPGYGTSSRPPDSGANSPITENLAGPLVAAENDNIAGTTSWDHARNADRIADTIPYYRVRNSSDFSMASGTDRGSVEVAFEITARVERDMSAAIAARKANLIKASKARWPH